MRKLAPLLTTLLLLATAACSSGGGSGAARRTTTSTKPGVSTTEAKATGSAASYATALATGLTANSQQSSRLQLGKKQAACVAPEWVKIIGVETFRAKKVNPSDVAEPGFGFTSLGIDQRQATQMIDAVSGCGVDTIKQVRSVLEAGLDASAQACIDKALTDATARSLIEQSLYRKQPTAALADQIRQVEDTCNLGNGADPTGPASPPADGAAPATVAPSVAGAPTTTGG